MGLRPRSLSTGEVSAGDAPQDGIVIPGDGGIPGDDPGDPAPQAGQFRYYCGDVVYDMGTTRLLTDEGYVTFSSDGTPQYHYYLRDHLGNVRVVFDQTGTVEQVNHYYAFGGLMRESTNPGVQPYKYGGKELDRTSGLDAYDFGARSYFADRLQWGTMDPLCEKYYDVTPYGYCKNDPVKNVDPDGRYVISKELAKKYPKLDIYLRKGIQGITKNPKIMHALRIAGRFTDDQIKDMVTYGKGPIINVMHIDGYYGYFVPDENSNTLNINEDIVKELESAEGLDSDISLFLTAVTILHESAHYGDDIAGNKEGEKREDGEVFEKYAYGKVITKDNAKDYLLDFYGKKKKSKDNEKEEQ